MAAGKICGRFEAVWWCVAIFGVCISMLGRGEIDSKWQEDDIIISLSVMFLIIGTFLAVFPQSVGKQ